LDQAFAYLNDALKIDGQNETAHAHIAQLYTQTGKLQSSIDHYNLGSFSF